VLFSIGISVYAVELLLPLSRTSVSWFNSKPVWEKKKVAQKFGVDFDTRSRLQVIKDLRKNGIDAVAAIAKTTWYLSRIDIAAVGDSNLRR
jgi:hypothetical protein